MLGDLKLENKPLRIRWYSFISLYTTPPHPHPNKQEIFMPEFVF